MNLACMWHVAQHSARRRAVVPATAIGTALLALTLATGSAQAHVGVTPSQARPATNETFTVRVPNEKDEATVRVRVEFPDGLVVSRFQSKPGWQRQVDRDSAGRIVAVTWSGGQIADGEYDDFLLIGRTPSEASKLSFRAFQTYAGGETVEWVDAEGGQRPAAIVEVRAAATTAGAVAANPSIEDAGRTAAGAVAPAAGAPTPGATPRPGGSASSASSGQAVVPSGGAAAPAPVGAETDSAGSDLSLFAALAAGALSLLAVALAGVALSRRPQPA